MNHDQALPAAVIAALQESDSIGAIKLLRELQGLGLKEAKDVVDRHVAGRPGNVDMPAATIDDDMPVAVLAALQQGRVIEAIKHLRAARGLGLKEAKDAVDAFRQRHPDMAGRQGTIIRDGGSRAWSWAVLAVAAAAALFVLNR